MTNEVVTSAEVAKLAREEAEKKHAAQLLRSTIMMVDDEPLMLEVLEMYLVEEGYRNFVAVDQSTEAMDILLAEMPDIVFLDINMPEVDGFDILQAIRANKSTKHLAVIILTSSNDGATKLKALEMGATDFLEKPIDSSELALRLRNTLTVKAYQDQLAYYDGLTGLPNRTLFLDRLDWAIGQVQRSGTGLAMMNITLDRFSEVNDSLGPQAGDEILKQVAERLAEVVREVDVIGRVGDDQAARGLARIGGDEFSILLPGLETEEQIKTVADRIMASIHKAFLFEDKEVFSTVSIGIARCPDDGDSTDLMVKNAGAANEYAKQQGRNNYQFFSADITRRANERMSLAADLHRALERSELQLYYQPQVSAQTGKVVGMEALIRWEHPVRGMVSPDQFVPLAEENGLIVSIGEWVLYEACRQTQQWHEEGLEGLEVSVNVAASQFGQPKFHDMVKDALTSTGLEPGCLMVEITEGAMMDDVNETARVLHEVKKLGVAFSIDDFGTGYSSLGYLKRFPLDELKIDRSFVTDIPGDADDTAIVRALIAMSHTLDLRIVAEGVESQEQLDFLRDYECDVMQGYFFSKPLSAADFSAFVLQNWEKSIVSPVSQHAAL